VKHYVRLALDQSLRMETLIDDLLTQAALESGASAASSASRSVRCAGYRRGCATAVGRATRGQPRHRRRRRGRGGARQREGIAFGFANLASNAVRYTPAGGTIRLSWRRVDGGAEFAVEDTGLHRATPHSAAHRAFLPRRPRPFAGIGGTGLGSRSSSTSCRGTTPSCTSKASTARAAASVPLPCSTSRATTVQS